MPDWLPPFLAATLTILLLNLALLEQRRRAHRRSWDRRLLRELRAWDGRLPVWGAKNSVHTLRNQRFAGRTL